MKQISVRVTDAELESLTAFASDRNISPTKLVCQLVQKLAVKAGAEPRPPKFHGAKAEAGGANVGVRITDPELLRALSEYARDNRPSDADSLSVSQAITRAARAAMYLEGYLYAPHADDFTQAHGHHPYDMHYQQTKAKSRTPST